MSPLYTKWIEIYSYNNHVTIPLTINVVDSSFGESVNSQFTIGTNNKKTKYDIWISTNSNYWDGTIHKAYATYTNSRREYKLPISVELNGTTSSGVNVSTSLHETLNIRPTGSTMSGNGIYGTTNNGDTFTMTISVDKNIIGTGEYVDFPSGEYSIPLKINVDLD